MIEPLKPFAALNNETKSADYQNASLQCLANLALFRDMYSHLSQDMRGARGYNN